MIEILTMKYKDSEHWERELNCAFIRINPDAVDFNSFREIYKIHRHIKNHSRNL